MTGIDDFWARVDRSGGPDSCWVWKAARFANQYGSFHLNGRNVRAHRWLLGFLRGAPLEPDQFACHRCDNPPCCNPAHLFVGSARDNSRDMSVKGRSAGQRKTHCPQGHAYTPENTYQSTWGRTCRECKLARERIPGAVVPAERTHCPQGHPYDEANTYRYGRNRYCRACNTDKARQRRAARRAAEVSS